MSDRFRAANPYDIEVALQHLSGPVSTAQLLAAAETAGASAQVRASLERLPARTWSSPSEAVAAATDGWAP